MNSDILLVDDDPIVARVMIEQLSGFGRVRIAGDACEAMAQVGLACPDLILLDMDLPEVHGLDLCKMLRSQAQLDQVPIVFVTSRSEPEFEMKALESGASNLLLKPANTDVLRAHVDRQLKLSKTACELRSQAMTDTSSGIASEARFDAALEQECRRAQRYRTGLCLLEIQPGFIDCPRQWHATSTGEDRIRQVASVLSACLQRPGDMLARRADNRFAALLPQTSHEGGMMVAASLLACLQDLAVGQGAQEPGRKVAAKMGMTWFDPDAPRPDGETQADAMRLARCMRETAENALCSAVDSNTESLIHFPLAYWDNQTESECAKSVESLGEPAQAKPLPSMSQISQWPSIAGIDSAEAKRKLCGNRELYGSLLTRLVDQFDGLADNWDLQRQAPELARNLHKLKGSSGTLGAMKLHQLSVEAEGALLSDDLALTGSLLTEIDREIGRIRFDCAQQFCGSN